jgi:pilus assembly protein CpaF
MGLRDRLLGRQNGITSAVVMEPSLPAESDGMSLTPPSLAPTPGISEAATSSGMYGRRIEHETLSTIDRVKIDLHRQLIERLDLEALEQIQDERLINAEIRAVVIELLRSEPTPLTLADREDIIEHVLYEITGLGPIEPLFRDPTISDILVNGSKEIFIERNGRLSRVAATFRNDAHVLAVIDRIVSRVGRRVDESSPMVDARLPDGSRVNAIIPPLAIDGPVLSIRRFGAGLTIQKLIDGGSFTGQMAELIAACVAARLNILVSGGTGSGKTTLLNAMASFIPPDQRIITIEDAAELRLQQEHVVRLETRPPNAEGEGEVAARDLVKNALRMRPDRIIVGEVRSGEALDMLQAMNTGHEGSLTTIHANSPRDALARLETMILMAGANLPDRAMREQIASALDLVIQVSRLADGTRKIVSMVEITGMEGPVTATQEIYRFRKKGIAPDGKVEGVYEATGIRPVFMERLAIAGVALPVDMFAEGMVR